MTYSMKMMTIMGILASSMILVQSNPLPPTCSQIPVNSNPEELDCYYGITSDMCGNKACLKGPGEMCGGKYGRYGTCADGLMCSNCNRCQGCSFRSFMCWDDKNCIW